eukprot:TRINITY_DN7004_c0_g1_i2.p1 TRINITY_DN7004_c0_g1~~TRINITY_DN7004_c0_g1_i2.p1  ORF type:complete len:569 (+),score=157.84 TRINITY_DN7004_c0_g1_i2:105-1709(+)
MKDWLLDPEGRDQYVVRHGSETEIHWNDPLRGGRSIVYAGDREKQGGRKWTESYVAWSPRGSYFVTFHHQGVVLWGGQGFQRIGRFAHQGVRRVNFSPCERFLVTFNANPEAPDAIIVWDIRSAKSLVTFDAGFAISKELSWPYLRWSHDDQFFARVIENGILVYDTNTVSVLDKPIRANGVRAVDWSPCANILSYWVPEIENSPARVSLLSIPSREPVREKHLFYVHQCKMHWHVDGHYLLVTVGRQNKAKKALPTMFEIFHMQEKNIPVDSFEMKENVVSFAWEPHGTRFAVIHNTGEQNAKNSISFYVLKNKKIVLEHTLDQRLTNHLFWSPAGSTIVLATLGSSVEEKTLEVYDATRREVLAQLTHIYLSDVEWDPSGRYFTSSSTQPVGNTNPRYQMENGYKVWTCKGKLAFQHMVDQLYQVLWRPRPPSLLSADQIKEIKRILRDKYFKKFEEADDEIRQSQLTGAAKERRMLRDQWRSYREEQARLYQGQAALRAELRGGLLSDSEDNYEEVETFVETELSVSEELL